MVRALAWNGYMGRGTQSAIGTGVVATDFQQVYTSGVKKNRPDKALKPTIRRTRGKTIVVKGNSSVGGPISGPLIPDEIFQAIGWADLMGGNNAVSGDATTGYTHTFDEPASASDYSTAGVTIEANKGSSGTELMFDYIGSFLKSLELTFPESGEVTWAAEYVGKDEESGGANSSPSYSTVNPFETCMVDIQIGTTISSTTSTTFKSGNWKYDNGVAMNYAGNSCTPVAATYAPIPIVNGTINKDLEEDLTEYNYWINDTDIAMKIVITHTELAGSSSGEYSLTINMPRVQVMGDSPELGSAEEIPQLILNYEALQHESLGYTCQVVIVNSESGTYSI